MSLSELWLTDRSTILGNRERVFVIKFGSAKQNRMREPRLRPLTTPETKLLKARKFQSIGGSPKRVPDENVQRKPKVRFQNLMSEDFTSL